MIGNTVVALITVAISVAVFIFSIRQFSSEVKKEAGEKFKRFLRVTTDRPIKGVFSGAIVTALIQSSTATTVLLVGLVDAGFVSVYQSLGVIYGANIGSALTSQLIALNVTSIAPYIVIGGLLVKFFGKKFSGYGAPIFYFGVAFLAIGVISSTVAPFESHPTFIKLITGITGVYTGILFGAIATALLQSSGLISALVVLLMGTGSLNFEQGIGIILGANIGTTSTALIASVRLSASARCAAFAHFIFNVGGVLICLPFIGALQAAASYLGSNPGLQIANIHMIFNIISAIIFLPFTRYIALFLERYICGKKEQSV